MAEDNEEIYNEERMRWFNIKKRHNKKIAEAIGQLKTLHKGDYIEASNLYYKVLGVKEDRIVLTDPFPKGSKPKGKFDYAFTDETLRYDIIHWNLIRQDSKDARGIEKKIETSKYTKTALEGECSR
jgi:hypothetical protein